MGSVIAGILAAVVLIGGRYTLYKHSKNDNNSALYNVVIRENATGEQSEITSEQNEKGTAAKTGRIDSVSKQLEDLAKKGLAENDKKEEATENGGKGDIKEDKEDNPKTADDDRPENTEDFNWLNDIMAEDFDFPEDTEFFASPDEISGRWKAIQKYFDDYGLLDEYNFSDMPAAAVELLNIDISEKGSDKAEFVFDWYKILYEGDPQFMDESDMDKISFVIDMSDEEPSDENEFGTLMIFGFWNSDDKQYGMGMLALPDDTFSIIGFMRP